MPDAGRQDIARLVCQVLQPFGVLQRLLDGIHPVQLDVPALIAQLPHAAPPLQQLAQEIVIRQLPHPCVGAGALATQ